MIDFRYHIVSLIAVFLALALGLFLGSTTLQSTVTHNLQQQAHAVTSRNHTLTVSNDALSAQLKRERAFIAGVGEYAIQDRLAGVSVAIVSAPGVSSNDATAMATMLQQAGATLTANVQLESAYLDTTQDSLLGGLAAQLKLPGHPLPAGNGSTAASSRLAAVLTARPGQTAVSKVRVEATLSALSDGNFISVDGGPPTHPASLAVMLVPAPTSATVQAAQAQNTILLALATQLRRTTAGMVVAGQSATPSIANGALAAVQDDSTLSKVVSTVDLGSDDQDATAGRIAVVLALAAAPTGKLSGFGLGQSPPVPTASASP